MEKDVLRSIKPKWVELIAAGQKTVEISKTTPKTLKVPFKVYIYQSKHKWSCNILSEMGLTELVEKLSRWHGKVVGEFICDKIDEYLALDTLMGEDDEQYREISEVVRRPNGQIEDYLIASIFDANPNDCDLLKAAWLSFDDLFNYVNNEKFYAWHISNLVIYDEPKELSQFAKKEIEPLEEIEGFDLLCEHCPDTKFSGSPLEGNYYYCGECACAEAYEEYKEALKIKQAPQSWCYCTKFNIEKG